jgi:hypothetical protein
MKITKRQLRRIIKESILLERGEVNVTQIKKYESEIREWVETLVDSMSDHVSDKIGEMTDKGRQRVLDNVTNAVVLSLIREFGHMTHSEEKYWAERDESKAHREWERKKSQSSARHYGEWGGFS